MNKKTVKDLNVEGKKVLVRVDFNVPLSKDGNHTISDDTRIKAALPTIDYLLENNAKVILMSHLGRPKGEANPEFSLKPVAEWLENHYGEKFHFLPSDVVVDEKVKEEVEKLENGNLALLENTRYVKGETKNDPEFAKELSSLADLFVNDAFGTSHRAHASNVGVASNLESAVGFLIQKEIEIMGKALENPEKPFVSILGGAKVSDKIGVIENLISKVDYILIGGGMAYTFLKAQGKEIGKSLLEEDKMDLSLELIKKAEANNVKILLPKDVVIADEIKEDAETEIVDIDNIPQDKEALDIGPKTAKEYADIIKKAKTVVWNGPMGVFEVKVFANGTNEVAKALADSSATTIVGGGDSALAIEEAGYKDKITHVSTGGGASLEFLEGKTLPGIDCIDEK
ncbi:phosphoglycerate kinase [Anaerococcus obesiensis]|uniref:Phosphoglycerate kinase n=1 Tax=Anaerococcus obesiensis TaxID=1287640 RepID=A0A7T7UTE5_9FIRM|nr:MULTISPECIES: phosphoglycerate kinase [Anaerococcus]MDU5085450.1 phosphoglycerate kinase [Anaerococcus vaginalis]OFL14578.1 phosphoglycerate kinase [Anaerococcus sp. HMSC068A02]QQN55892.1 phosphoglycerate kinase [Anaerococcus obesiensis]